MRLDTNGVVIDAVPRVVLTEHCAAHVAVGGAIRVVPLVALGTHSGVRLEHTRPLEVRELRFPRALVPVTPVVALPVRARGKVAVTSDRGAPLPMLAAVVRRAELLRATLLDPRGVGLVGTGHLRLTSVSCVRSASPPERKLIIEP